MPKKIKKLIESFKPISYEVSLTLNNQNLAGTALIKGQKTGRPSKRITFHQNGLKINNCRLIRSDKKGEVEFEVDRINHLKNKQEVRLHSPSTLFPGFYTIVLDFTKKQKIDDLVEFDKIYENHHPSQVHQDHLGRQLFPSIDEEEGLAHITINFSKEPMQS